MAGPRNIWEAFQRQQMAEEGILAEVDRAAMQDFVKQHAQKYFADDVEYEPETYAALEADVPRAPTGPKPRSRIEILQTPAPGMPGGRTWSIRQIMDGAK